jgi:hypothetical protein
MRYKIKLGLGLAESGSRQAARPESSSAPLARHPLAPRTAAAAGTFASSELVTHLPASLRAGHSTARQSKGGSLATGFPWTPWRLIATVARLEIHSTPTKHATKQISNRNKYGTLPVSAQCFVSSSPTPLSQFLVANPGLECRVSHSKQIPLTFSNREYIAVFQSANLQPPAPNDRNACTTQPVGHAFRIAGLRSAPLNFSASSLITHHSSLVPRPTVSSDV